jgi:hypothetical protein
MIDSVYNRNDQRVLVKAFNVQGYPYLKYPHVRDVLINKVIDYRHHYHNNKQSNHHSYEKG